MSILKEKYLKEIELLRKQRDHLLYSLHWSPDGVKHKIEIDRYDKEIENELNNQKEEYLCPALQILNQT